MDGVVYFSGHFLEQKESKMTSQIFEVSKRRMSQSVKVWKCRLTLFNIAEGKQGLVLNQKD